MPGHVGASKSAAERFTNQPSDLIVRPRSQPRDIDFPLVDEGVKSVEEATGRMTRVAHVRYPDDARGAVYREAARVYAELYPTLRSLFPQLSRLRALSTPQA